MAKVNKDARNLKNQTNVINDKVNKEYEENAEKIKKTFKQSSSDDMTIVDDIDQRTSSILLPHQRTVEDIIIITRETFFHVLQLLADKKNPIPYIQDSPDRFFCIALVMIILGTLLLLLSNLMKSKDE
jgi:hypothetical protein